MSDTTNNTASPSSEQPSMVGGHLKYIQGAASSALGYQSGEQTKQEAIEQMREANKNSDTPTGSNVLGSVEKAAGDLTGCAGMSNEGESRKTTGAGSESSSGTG